MEVFKFGGASVNSADAVRNVGKILQQTNGQVIVVISAMGKTTNLLETLVRAYFEKDALKWDIFSKFRDYHTGICDQLFGRKKIPLVILSLLADLERKLHQAPSLDFNFEYDQIVCFGELVSTRIVSEYLNLTNITNQWVDVRGCIRTDDVFRDASVDWSLTAKLSKEIFDFREVRLYITQGFIASTPSNLTTTLGREGSDFSAAILGNVLNARGVFFWKDVPGVLSADPQKMKGEKIDVLSYREAVEITHSGAKIIHPKTMKPLHNKKIPLFVKSFLSPLKEGTIIHEIDHRIDLPPIFIFRENLVLVTLSPKDFSFISMKDIDRVVNFLLKNRVKIVLMQQSAIDLNLVLDAAEIDTEWLIRELTPFYSILYNTGLTLITVRHYTEETLAQIARDHDIFLEQHSRLTARVLVKG